MAQFFRLKYGYETVLFYLAFFLGMLFLNFTMDRGEPFSLALLAAGLVCGALALVWQGRGNLSLLLTALWLLAAPAAGNMRMERLG